MDIDPDLIAAGAAFQRKKQIQAQQELVRIARDARIDKTLRESKEMLEKFKKEDEREEKKLLRGMTAAQKKEYFKTKQNQQAEIQEIVRKKLEAEEKQRQKEEAQQGALMLWTIGIIIALFVGGLIFINMSGK